MTRPTQLALFGDPPLPALPAGDEWAPVEFRLYGLGWPCPLCCPIPTYWSTVTARDLHTATAHGELLVFTWDRR